jgi:hypothetical protein
MKKFLIFVTLIPLVGFSVFAQNKAPGDPKSPGASKGPGTPPSAAAPAAPGAGGAAPGLAPIPGLPPIPGQAPIPGAVLDTAAALAGALDTSGASGFSFRFEIFKPSTKRGALLGAGVAYAMSEKLSITTMAKFGIHSVRSDDIYDLRVSNGSTSWKLVDDFSDFYIGGGLGVEFYPLDAVKGLYAGASLEYGVVLWSGDFYPVDGSYKHDDSVGDLLAFNFEAGYALQMRSFLVQPKLHLRYQSPDIGIYNIRAESGIDFGFGIILGYSF